MRILHLFANWKWTGPAEPALNVAWQQAREHEVRFLSGRPPEGETSRIEPHQRARGVPGEAGRLHLSKHGRFRRNREDIAALSELLLAWRPEIVHTHLDNDHRIAAAARSRTGVGRLVRTAYDAGGLSPSFRTRRVAARAMHGLIVTTPTGYEQTLAAYGGAAQSVSVAGRPVPYQLIEGGIDFDRFDPSRFDRATRRAVLGLRDEHVALGIVARVQPHRRFDLLLPAFARVLERHPHARLVVIGRGTRICELLHEPVAALGIGHAVVTPGYLGPDDFVGALSALDATLFLVPGSDGTCRALREQMAMGLASLVTPRPPLPDVIEEGVTGLVVEESEDGLTEGMLRLVGEPGLRRRLCEGAREAARRRFDLREQARAVTAFYGRVLEAGAPQSARPAPRADALDA